MRFFLFSIILLLVINMQAQNYDTGLVDALGEKATSYMLEGRHHEAKALYAKMAKEYRKYGDAEREIGALSAVVSLTSSLADKKSSLKDLELRAAAIRKPKNPTLIKAYLSQAKAECFLLENNLDKAQVELLAVLDESRAMETDEEDPKFAFVNILQTLGTISNQKGAHREAIAYYNEADKVMGVIYKPMGFLYKAINEMNMGVAYRALGNLSVTEDRYQNSLSYFKMCGGDKSAYYSYLLINLSSLYHSQALYSDALDYGHQALNSLDKNLPTRIPTLIECAAASCALGQYAEAENMLKEAVELSNRFGSTASWTSMLEAAQMNLYRFTGRLKASVELGEKMLNRLKRQKQYNPQEMYTLYRRMSYNSELLGNKEEAVDYIMSAIDVYKKAYGTSNDEYFSLNYRYGNLLYEMGEKEKGKNIQNLARKYLEMKYGADSPYVQSLLDGWIEGVMKDVGTLLSASGADIRARRFDDAQVKVEEVIRLLRQSRVQGVNYMNALALRMSILESKQDYKSLATAAEEYNEELRRDMKENLSYMTEQERESYYESVLPPVDYAYLTDLHPALSSSVYDAILLRKNFLLGAGLGLEKLIADSGDADLQKVLSEMKALRSGPAQDVNASARSRYVAKHMADSLENKLVRASHSYGDYLSLADIHWQDIKKSLAADEVAVEFYQSGSEIIPVYCVSVLRNDWVAPRNIVLFQDQDHMIEAGMDPQYITTVYSQSGYYKAFWEPLEAYLKKGDRVYFSLGGFLNAYAFEHFVTETGDRAMDRFELHRVSSTRELINRKYLVPKQSAALFGGFDYNLSGDEVEYYASSTRSASSAREWNYLPGSLTEVEAASKILKGKLTVSLFTGEKGLESRFKAYSGASPDLLHIATHGYYTDGDTDPMERAGLVFSGANSLHEDGPVGSGEDGLLKASEIALLDLRGTDLVVLSACQSGVGSISSDGVYGLQRAFKKAGVHSVLMSLWDVDDQVTAEMMRLFYTGLSSGMSTLEAFQFARKGLREVYSDPQLWAPFILLEA